MLLKPKTKNFELSRLHSKHLKKILVNLSFGEEYLKSILNHVEYEALLKIASLTKEQKHKIPSEVNEKAGSTATVINTILTGLVGAWLGLYDYIDINIDPLVQLIFVICIVFILSSVIGFLNYRSTTEESGKSIRKQKLKNLQLRLFEIFLMKRKKSIKKIIFQSNQLLGELYIKSRLRRNNRIFFHDDMNKENKNYEVKSVLLGLINKHLNNTKFSDRTIINEVRQYFTKFLKNDTNRLNQYQKKYYPHYFKILIRQELNPPKSSLTIRAWLLENKQKIFITFFPALFGVLGSTFVYLGGVPNIFDKIKFLNINYIFEHPVTKIIGLFLAIMITLYLSYFSVKNVYRSYMRDKAIVFSDQKIAEIQSKIMDINKKYVLISQLFLEIKKLILILKILENHENIDNNQS